MCSVSPECPPGHRLMQTQDLAVGKCVVYIRGTGEHLQAKIVDAKMRDGDRIKLEAKSQAPISRVFVPDEAAGGVEATGSATAAVGAVASAENGASGAIHSPSIAPATNEAVVPTFTQETMVETNNFIRDEVVGWMSSLEAGGSSLAEAFDVAMTALGKTPEEMARAFKVKVPWETCLNFQSMPKIRKTGKMHISMLSYRPYSYAANGMFVGDAIRGLKAKGIAWVNHHIFAVRP